MGPTPSRRARRSVRRANESEAVRRKCTKSDAQEVALRHLCSLTSVRVRISRFQAPAALPFFAVCSGPSLLSGGSLSSFVLWLLALSPASPLCCRQRRGLHRLHAGESWLSCRASRTTPIFVPTVSTLWRPCLVVRFIILAPARDGHRVTVSRAHAIWCCRSVGECY